MGEHLIHFQGPRDQVTINELPDDALLDIFDSYLNDNDRDKSKNVDEWHTLVHVCRMWRNVVFASPRRLNLRLLCNKRRPVRTMLNIWPALPIVVETYWIRARGLGLDNVLAVLEHPDRLCSIEFNDAPDAVLRVLATEMRVPFPELTYLRLGSDGGSTAILPDLFLGGSTPRLRKLKLRGILFPALPNLLLSASDLVYLSLRSVPHSGYISPEAMVACLSSLNRLKLLDLGFQSCLSRPDRPSLPPQTRVTLPALTDLFFGGMIDYSEDFLARIETPVLNQLSTSFLLDFTFDIPHLKQFISRAKDLKPYKVARVWFTTGFVQLSLTEPLPLSLEMMCDMMDLKVRAMSSVCGQLSPFLSLVERLDLTADYWPSKPQGEDDDTVSSGFLELFRSFTAVRSLRVSEDHIPFIALALQQLIGERASEVLPNLRDLFMEGSKVPRTVQSAMQPFLTARRLSGQPVAVHHWGGSTADR